MAKKYTKKLMDDAMEGFTKTTDPAEQTAALRDWFVKDLELQREVLVKIGLPTTDIDATLAAIPSDW